MSKLTRSYIFGVSVRELENQEQNQSQKKMLTYNMFAVEFFVYFYLYMIYLN